MAVVTAVGTIDGANLERRCDRHHALIARRQRIKFVPIPAHRRDRFRRGDLRHRALKLDAGFELLKRRLEGEDRLPVLNRGHPPGRETFAIAAAIDRIDHGLKRIRLAQEVRVE